MDEQVHELWLIYKDMENREGMDDLRERLGKVINELNKPIAAIFAAKGGAAKSDAKAAAARANGAKGGRPRKNKEG